MKVCTDTVCESLKQCPVICELVLLQLIFRAFCKQIFIYLRNLCIILTVISVAVFGTIITIIIRNKLLNLLFINNVERNSVFIIDKNKNVEAFGVCQGR